MALDLSDIALRLVAALAAGMLLGFDRQRRGKAAGLRTHTMVALSSAGITVLAVDTVHGLGFEHSDPLRVIQGLAQAIGFICAGIIIQGRGDVRNLTTAATLWMACVLGIAAGAGAYIIAGMLIGMTVLALWSLTLVEHWLERRQLLPGDEPADRPEEKP